MFRTFLSWRYLLHRRTNLIGIGGTGMTALAGLLHQSGCRVTGSDQALYPPTSTILESLGLEVYEGFDAAHLDHDVAALKAFMHTFPFAERFGLTARFMQMHSKWRRGMTPEDRQRVVGDFGQAARRAALEERVV